MRHDRRRKEQEERRQRLAIGALIGAAIGTGITAVNPLTSPLMTLGGGLVGAALGFYYAYKFTD